MTKFVNSRPSILNCLFPFFCREPASHSRCVPLRGSWCYCFLAIVLVSHSSLQETTKEEEILHEEQKERRGRRRKQN